jgi:hypothetical protein
MNGHDETRSSIASFPWLQGVDVPPASQKAVGRPAPQIRSTHRLIATAILGALLPAAAPATAEDEAAPSTDTAAIDKERARRLEQMVAAAADYQLWRGEDEQPLERVERPVLRWSNPFRAADDGAVFIWADKKDEKRPAAAMCIYGSGADGVEHEWQSLSTEKLRATYRGATVWRPQTAGLQFHAVPGATEPVAATPARRLAQMHGLLRDFGATVGREPQQHELRVLTHPIYRYGDEHAELIDGAVFAFAQGTDPEILLFLEAQRQIAGPASWSWAAARMSMVPLDLKYRGALVWNVDWHYGNDDRQPRVTFLRDRTEP